MRHPAIGLAIALGFLQMRSAAWSTGVLVVSLGLISPAFAAPKSWVHNRWTTEDGLPQNSVQTMATDGAGYLWLGTQEGLVRYDGQRFTVFAAEAGLGCLVIEALATTAQGDLAVGTDACAAYLVHRREITRLTGVPADARVRALAAGAGGALLIGTDHGLLSRTPAGVVSLYDQSEVTAIATTQAGEVYFAVHGAVGLLHGGALTWVDRTALPGDDITSIAVEGSNLWVASRDGVAVTSATGMVQLGLQQGLPCVDVQVVTVLDHSVWVATGEGVARFEGRRFIPLEVANAPRHRVGWRFEYRASSAAAGVHRGLRHPAGTRRPGHLGAVSRSQRHDLGGASCLPRAPTCRLPPCTRWSSTPLGLNGSAPAEDWCDAVA